MFEKQQKIELMIVSDDKSMQYANYLVQLIGQIDDGEDATVGTKDGIVSAAIYTNKQYNDTRAKITSNTHILFIGNNKTTKEQAKFMQYQVDCYGMHYGWCGKRAVMFVDKMVRKEEYNDFVDFAKKYQLEYQKKNTDNKAANIAGAGVGVVVAKAALPVVAGVGVWLLAPIAAAPSAIFGLVKSAKAKEEEMKEQQYRCLTLAMYMDGLQKFLEE